MKTFEFVEADRKTVLVVDVADDNPIASTLVDLEHLNLTMHAENSRLRKVVDAALAIDKQAQFCWEFCPDDLSDAFCNALREVDGEKKCGLCTDTKPCNFEACPDDK